MSCVDFNKQRAELLSKAKESQSALESHSVLQRSTFVSEPSRRPIVSMVLPLILALGHATHTLVPGDESVRGSEPSGHFRLGVADAELVVLDEVVVPVDMVLEVDRVVLS